MQFRSIESWPVVPIRFVLCVFHDDDFPTVLTSCCERLVLRAVDGTASKEYAHVRGLLESAYRLVDEALADDAYRITRDDLIIRTQIDAFGGELEDQLQQLAQIVTTQLLRDDSTHSDESLGILWRPIFYVRKMFVDTRRAREISPKAMLHLTHIAKCGIALCFFVFHDMPVATTSAVVFAKGLQVLTGTPTRENESKWRAKPLKDMEMLPMSVRSISALFSALRVSQTVEEVTINTTWRSSHQQDARVMTRDERTHLWKWVAVAMFSRCASHQLKNVHLVVPDLDADDVAAFRKALEHPEAVMLEDDAPDVTASRRLETVTASQFMLQAPNSTTMNGFDQVTTFDPLDVLAETDGRDPDWLRVILPGCGRAWVHRSSATPSDSTALAGYPGQPLDISIGQITDRSKDEVLEVLQLIGHRIERLHFAPSSTQDLMDEWLQDVGRACPRLKSLGVTSGLRITSMEVFVKVFEHCCYRLEKLELYHAQIDHSDSITRFLALLADDSLKISKHLRDVMFKVENLEAPLVDIMPTIDAMLSSNFSLQKLELSVPFQPHVSFPSSEDVASLCEKHQGKPVAVRESGLSLDRKIAFCSILSMDEGYLGTAQVLRYLDQQVLTLIFEFAATCATRDLSIRFYAEDDEAEDDDGDDEENVGDDDEVDVDVGDL